MPMRCEAGVIPRLSSLESDTRQLHGSQPSRDCRCRGNMERAVEDVEAVKPNDEYMDPPRAPRSDQPEPGNHRGACNPALHVVGSDWCPNPVPSRRGWRHANDALANRARRPSPSRPSRPASPRGGFAGPAVLGCRPLRFVPVLSERGPSLTETVTASFQRGREGSR